MKQKVMDSEMAARVKEMPEFLKSLPARGWKNKEQHKVLSALRILPSDKVIPYQAEEFLGKFGKHGKAGLRQFLKLNGIKCPRIVEDGGTFFIFKNDI